MRIVTIRFTNLNSLAGSWQIDFTNPEYTSSGIFAIVGATGPGKSTILDAVSLALYGRTPRVKQISKSSNDIMTRHTGECSAEIEFVSAKGHFRCHWSQHRARKQPGGELQQPRHEISDSLSGKILETKIKDVARAVVDATGMDFDQFTRSMLLAQGDFNKFLQASADERAPILEQITGTEIYSKISRQVHELTSSHKQKLDLLKSELSSFHLLSSDEEKMIHSQIKELEQANSAQQQVMTTIRSHKAWLQNVEKLAGNVTILSKQLADLDNEIRIFQPQLQSLKRAISANALSVAYEQVGDLKKQQEHDLKQLADAESGLEKTRKTISLLADKTLILQKNREQATEIHQRSQSIFREVTKLDQLIARLRTEQAEQTTSAQDIEAAIKRKENNKIILTRQLQRVNEEWDRTSEYLKKNKHDNDLLASISGIEVEVHALAKVEGQKNNLSKVRQDLTARLEAQQKILVSAQTARSETGKLLEPARLAVIRIQERFDASPSANQLFTARQQLREKLSEIEICRQLAKELEDIQKRRVLVAEQITHREAAIKERRVSLQAKERELKQCTIIAEQEEEIVLLAAKVKNFEKERNLLREGSPCPLCGSQSHPFTRDSRPLFPEDPRLRLRKARENLERCRNEKEEIQTAILNLDHQNSKDHELLVEIDSTSIRTRENLKARTGDQPDNRGVESFLEKNAFAIRKDLEKIELEIKTSEELQKELPAKKNQYEKLADAFSRYDRDVETALVKIEALHHECEKLTDEFAQTNSTLNSIRNNLANRHPAFQTGAVDAAAINTIYLDLEKKKKLFEDAKNINESKSREQQHIASELQSIDATMQELLLQKNSLKKKLDQTGEELRNNEKQRRELFGDKNVDAEENLLLDQLRSAEEIFRGHTAELNNLEKNLASFAERIKNFSDTIAERTAKISSKQEEFLKQLGDHGFATVEDYLAALLPATRRDQLQAEADRLLLKRAETQTLLSNTSADLEQQREQNLTDKSLAELDAVIREHHEIFITQQQEIGALRNTLQQHAAALVRLRDKQLLLSQLEQEYDYWCRLHSLIGSADGKKFRNFAQGITFELMISHANRQLIKMSDRYILVRDFGQPLDLHVRDNYQGGEIRTTANLSGGESFIVSLALALGLASMAGRNIRVDTLFLDEGFGTLDEESLDVALDTLSSLHQEGKLIGIISHVHLLKERISVQLNLNSGPNGRSTVSGPGVKRLK